MQRRSLLGMASSVLWRPAQGGADGPGTSRVFDARQFGAKGNGTSNDTRAIQSVIDAAFHNGGGVAYLPPGTYLSGTVEIKSNVTFYLEAGATLLGSTELGDYSPRTGPNPKGDANDKHLVFARSAENIAIAGLGSIDGQGQHFWTRSGRPATKPEDMWRDVATYDWKPLARPSPMVELVECRNVHVQGITLKNSPGWTFRPLNCDSVFIEGIRIRNPIYGPNLDGIDPTGSQNVFISNCDIDTADDAICLKSENPYGGEIRVSRNITITNCILSCCCNGLKLGTATFGGFENITFSNSVIYNRDVPLNQRVISGLAIEMVDGGWVDGLVISNIRMQNVRTPIFVRLGTRHASNTGRRTYLRSVKISGIQATGAILTSSITGVPGLLPEDITLSDIRINTDEPGKAEWNLLDIPEQEKAYPEARMFGRLPSYGLYIRHAKKIRLSNVDIRSTISDPRPLLTCDDIEELEVDGLKGTAPASGKPLLDFRNVRQAHIRNCIAPAGVHTYLQVSGRETQEITLIANDLKGAASAVEFSHEAPAESVHLEANRISKPKSA